MKASSSINSKAHTQQEICAHCGELCLDEVVTVNNKNFCCNGCSTVYQLIQSKDLCDYYAIDSLAKKPSLKHSNIAQDYTFLDDADIQKSLRLYTVDAKQSRIYFKSSNIHCSSCLYLLENLAKFHKAIVHSEAHFNTKTIAVWFNREEIKISEIAVLLHSLGYTPSVEDEALNSTTQEGNKKYAKSNSLLIRLGIAGFAAGNTMMLSFPTYLGLDETSTKFKSIFLLLNIVLSSLVVVFSSAPWFKNAFRDLKYRQLGVDVPIAIAVGTLYIRSIIDIVFNLGPGFFDSLNGLVFLLLIGKWLQTRYYEGLNFEHQYSAYFPLSVKKRGQNSIEQVVLSKVKVGDALLFSAGDLIPVDGLVLKANQARIDSSFLNGETYTKRINLNDSVLAGEKLHSGELEIEVSKEANQSYLYTLWNEASQEKKKEALQMPFEKFFVKYFTLITIALALAAFFYWMNKDLMIAYNAFTAVLMVACPCALTLALPFAAGKAMSKLAENGLYLKNAEIVTKLAQINELVFDKTGTITDNVQSVDGTKTENNSTNTVEFVELPYLNNTKQASEIVSKLYIEEIFRVAGKLSAHPLLQSVVNSFPLNHNIQALEVQNFEEHLGAGIEFYYNNTPILIGSPAFCNIPLLKTNQSVVAIAINGIAVGYFELTQKVREGLAPQLERITLPCTLLTGDSKEATFNLIRKYTFFKDWQILSTQKPEDKYQYIKDLKEQNKFPMMIGDGMNDAAAMKVAVVSLALVNNSKAFAPSSDAIAQSNNLWKIHQWIRYAKQMLRMVKISFILSLVYNFIGLGLAISGNLSPMFAAFFMPLSSLSVVALAVILTNFQARKLK